MNNHKKNLSLLIFSLLLLRHISAEHCHPDDKKALLRFMKASNYALGRADLDCCTWYGVKCDWQSHRVTDLKVTQTFDFVGPIPDAVGDLPYLRSLFFIHLPNLTGPIPRTLTRLKNLQYLWLSYTNIAGPIPEFLSQITNLFYINLSVNKLSGPIPPSLSKLHKLGALYLQRNQLTGSIPESFGRFKVNPNFDLILAKNQLSGPIPESLGNVDFSSLDLSRNYNLTGDASMFFGRNKGLETVDLSRNQFSFDMTKVVFPQNITAMDLSHNKIHGTLPPSLSEFTYFQLFNVSYNKLCGPIPTGQWLTTFNNDSFVHNKCLCGSPLPPCNTTTF